MSRPISESLELLDETLSNCKTNLTEKKVENVEDIKISDVDEKIAEIQSGGGNEFECTFNSIKLYTEAEDDNPYYEFDIETSRATVKNCFFPSYGRYSSRRFKKITFDLSVKNADLTSPIYGIILLETLNKNNPQIEKSGEIVNGSGNVQFTIKYSDTVYMSANKGNFCCVFYFGPTSENYRLNTVFFGTYTWYS